MLKKEHFKDSVVKMTNGLAASFAGTVVHVPLVHGLAHSSLQEETFMGVVRCFETLFAAAR